MARKIAASGDDAVLELLTTGEVEVVARIVPSSNHALLVRVSCGERTVSAVYKPEAGERPLWDFEPGLYRREVAAYLLSDALGWGLVPPTVVRDDAPAGVGSLQLWIEADPSEHYFTLYESAPETLASLRAMAVFDVLANNADRKSGHVLLGPDGRIQGIDHGLCFAADDKLRTVIWDFAGEPIGRDLLDGFAPLADEVPAGLSTLLDEWELDALRDRARRLLAAGRLPVDLSGYRVPWPLV
ncbi:MAG: SCO1664 family protein [Actinobacteria bacterium]|nr:SCO1664 family protein [Actinomycetota bacterium]